MAPFSINKAELQDLWVADRRLWLTSDRKEAVEDGDPRSAFLLVAPGQGMPRKRAEELGVIRKAPDMKEKAKPEDKQMAAPEDKQIVPPESKRQTKRVTKSRKTAKRKKKISKRA